MRVTDNRQSIFDRSPHSRSRHSISSKSPPLPSPHSNPKHTNSSLTLLKQTLPTNYKALTSATDTPQFSNDPSKFVYNCEQIYALLESVKIERSFETSIELIGIIKETIAKLSKKKGLEGEIEALLRVLSNIERKLGYRGHEREEEDGEQEKTLLRVEEERMREYKNRTRRELIKEKEREPEMIHQHEIEFSLVSNWKEMTGKEVIYTNFSLLEEDSMKLTNENEAEESGKEGGGSRREREKQNKSINMNSRLNKYSLESNSSNILVADLNLQIEMLDSLLDSKLKNKKQRSLHPSINSETIKKIRPKKMLF